MACLGSGGLVSEGREGESVEMGQVGTGRTRKHWIWHL